MTRKAKVPHNRATLPQDEGTKKPKNPTISAKVPPEIVALVDHAAGIKGWPRQRVVEEGAIQYAQLIIAEQGERAAKARKAMRSAKARLGGLAKARKAQKA